MTMMYPLKTCAFELSCAKSLESGGQAPLRKGPVCFSHTGSECLSYGLTIAMAGCMKLAITRVETAPVFT